MRDGTPCAKDRCAITNTHRPEKNLFRAQRGSSHLACDAGSGVQAWLSGPAAAAGMIEEEPEDDFQHVELLHS
jgi:hypothetical protein